MLNGVLINSNTTSAVHFTKCPELQETSMGAETKDTQLLIKKVKLFEAIVNKSQNAVIVFNDQLEISFANVAAAELLHQTPAELRGHAVADLFLCENEEERAELVARFRAANANSANTNPAAANKEEQKKTQRVNCNRPQAAPLPASITIEEFIISGTRLYIVSLLDMTATDRLERKRSKAEMNHFQAVQQKKYAAETLQTNLQKNITQIAKTAQGIKDTYNLDPISDAMTSIMQYAFSTLSLSQKAIFISEVMKDQAALNLVDRSFYGALERLRLMVENKTDKRLTLDWTIPAYARKIKLKHDQAVEQILYNLLDDAASYTINGKIGLEINRLEPVDDVHVLMEIAVKNPHHGVSQHLMDAVLAAGSAASLAREHNLHLDGLCLRLAKHQTEQFGGQFRIISHPVEGTEVFIKLTLPVIDSEAAKPAETSEPAAPAGQVPPAQAPLSENPVAEAPLSQDAVSEDAASEGPESAITLSKDPLSAAPQPQRQRPLSAADVLSGDQPRQTG